MREQTASNTEQVIERLRSAMESLKGRPVSRDEAIGALRAWLDDAAARSVDLISSLGLAGCAAQLERFPA